jgi:hypothetical protein
VTALKPWEKPLADSLKTILADRLDQKGDRITWQPPMINLDIGELREAEAHLGARLIEITKKDFVLCMLALRNMLAIPDDDTMTWDARIKLYWAGLNDHPADLLETSVDRCIKTEVWFPKVAVIRAKVAEELRLRRDMLARCTWLIDNVRNLKPAPKPFVPEPLHVRYMTVIAAYRRHEKIADAERVERELSGECRREIERANAESREPATWATDWLRDHPPIERKSDAAIVHEVLSQIYGPPVPPPQAPAANVTPAQVGDLEW